MRKIWLGGLLTAALFFSGCCMMGKKCSGCDKCGGGEATCEAGATCGKDGSCPHACKHGKEGTDAAAQCPHMKKMEEKKM